MVWTDLASSACSAGCSLSVSRMAMRSADSWMGVSGFLISWATRRATSPQAWARWAETISERSEEHTSELQSHLNLVCRLLLEKKKNLNRSGKLLSKRHLHLHLIILNSHHPRVTNLPP